MTNARSLAIKLLDQIGSGHHTLDSLIRQSEPQIQRLNRSDRALLHAIVFGVMRWQASLDWKIDHLLSRPGKKIDPLVRIILRAGLFQIQCLDRIPVSAAVNTSVELAKQFNRRWASGFVNSILRHAAVHGETISWPDRQKKPLTFLSVYHSFPQWLLSRWSGSLGLRGVEQLCKAINTIPRITLRTNTLHVDRAQLVDTIQDEVQSITNTRHSPVGISFSSMRRPFSQWPAFQKGWFQVQNEAAQCIGYLLSPKPGHRVWDACAGLGTKTAHLAQLMENKGYILASDFVQPKLDALETEMQRLGIAIVETRSMDLTGPAMMTGSETYDRILVDAPCTGLGVLQKNPDGKWRAKPESIRANAQRQLALLERAAPHLKSEGRLVYAVCSFEPEENEQVVYAFLQKHPEFVIDHPRLDHVQNGAKLLTSEGFLKTYPHLHHMDGFFAAVIKRR